MSRMLLAEQSAAGAILLDGACLPVLRQICRPSDFASAPCQAIFRSACRLADRGETLDPVLIQRDAAAHGDTLTTEFLMQLMELTPTAAHAEAYAAVVRENALRRAVRETAETLLEQAQDETLSTASLLSGAMEQLQGLDAGSSGGSVTSEQAAEAFLDYRDALETGRDSAVVSTGIPRLDRLLEGGMLRAGLYILAARPGVGKTTVGLKIADRVSRQQPVLFVSLEMDTDQLTARRLADRSGIRIGRVLLEQNLTEDERQKLAEAAADMAQSRLYLTSSAATVDEIALQAHSIGGLGLIVVDYLGLLSGGKGSLYERVTANSNALKRLARRLRIPILCLCQLNRQSEQRPDKLPTMADLRDSGAIEQDADAVLLLHRPALSLPMGQRPKPWEAEVLEITAAKNRHGQTGRIHLNLYGTNGRITE